MVVLLVGEAEALALVGEAGCGKSVTAKAVMGLIKAPQGEVLAGSGIPLFLLGCLEAVEDVRWSKKWSMLFCITGFCVTLTSMGAVLVPLLAGCFGLYNAWKKKQPMYLLNTFLVCLPAAACAGMYLLVKILL